jgi:ADP-ribose pyrophosphatase YjhB (NUDIX family)
MGTTKNATQTVTRTSAKAGAKARAKAGPENAARPPDIQLIANAVITDGRGRVLLTRYGSSDGGGEGDEERWWLPGTDLKPYEHPDDALRRALAGLVAAPKGAALHHVESFRGRRGWHVMFNHRVKASTTAATAQGRWFAADALPRMAHGRWEQQVIAKVLGG